MDTPNSDEYARRRESSALKYKPNTIRLLLVGEAPSDELDRYFYFDDVPEQDPLFRYVARSILETEPTRDNKSQLLGELRDEGVFLIDLKEDPLGDQPLSSYVPDLIHRALSLEPQSVILIKVTVYDEAFVAMHERGLPVVDERIPFPVRGWQGKFEGGMARALEKAGYR